MFDMGDPLEFAEGEEKSILFIGMKLNWKLNISSVESCEKKDCWQGAPWKRIANELFGNSCDSVYSC